MTEITDAAATKTGSLSTLRLAELQQLASSMGISVSAKMRKADLVSAIREQRGGGARGGSDQPTTPAAGEAVGTQPQGDAGGFERDRGASEATGGIEAALDRAQAQREETTVSRPRRSRRAGAGVGAPPATEQRSQEGPGQGSRREEAVGARGAAPAEAGRASRPSAVSST